MPISGSQSVLNATFLQAREAMLVFFRPVFNRWCITEQQWRIIRILAEEGQQDFHVLAEKACLLRPSLTGILNRVEKMGLVSRRKPATDQRKVLLKLTSQGEKLYQDMCAEIDAQYVILEKTFGSNSMNKLTDLLSDLKKAADQHRPD